jgi:hypothetical protein
MALTLRSKADTRAVIQPETTAFGLLLRHFQPSCRRRASKRARRQMR